MMTDEERRQCRNEGGVPLKTEEVGKGSDGEIKHDVHSPCVYGIDELLPVSDGTPMGVKYAEVEGGIT